MKAVVDTDVVAYLILGTEQFADEARGVMAALDEAAKRLTLADGLGIHSVPNRTLWQGALVRAHEAKVAVYDTLFVELAVREQVPLATFDGGVLKAFPTVAVRPSSLFPK